MKIFSKKRIAVLCVVCLIVCMVSGFTTPTAGADTGAVAAAKVKTISAVQDNAGDAIPVYINGIKASNAFKIGDAVYMPLRDFFDASELPTDINWNEQTGTVTVTAENLKMTAVTEQPYVTANNRCFYVPDGLQQKDGVLSLPIRTLAVVLQYSVDWDAQSTAVSLTADKPSPLASAAAQYNKQDLYWLSHIINAEAGNQPFAGKIGVGNVVMNRVTDPTCPNTIHDVVFDSHFGVQFSVVSTGGIYAEPNVDSVAAAKACLEGANVVGNALYFVNPTIASSKWFDQTRTFVATIGEHDFYA